MDTMEKRLDEVWTISNEIKEIVETLGTTKKRRTDDSVEVPSLVKVSQDTTVFVSLSLDVYITGH